MVSDEARLPQGARDYVERVVRPKGTNLRTGLATIFYIDYVLLVLTNNLAIRIYGRGCESRSGIYCISVLL